jgi:acetyltransferase-like isoleucine patch superfamily enzyme
MGDTSCELVVHKTARVAETVRAEGRGRVTIGPHAVIEDHVLFSLGQGGRGTIEVGRRSKLKVGVIARAYGGRIRIGDRTSIGEYSVLAGHGGLDIGDLVIIAGHCYLAASQHITSGTAPLRFQGETASGIHVADDVWIGAHATVHDGVTIGRGAIVGSGSVVTRSLPGGWVAFGVPCRPVHRRDLTESQPHAKGSTCTPL